MRPLTKLPKDSEEVVREGEFLIVKYSRSNKPFYSIYKFFESKKGMRYFPRGGGSNDLELVKQQFERITGKKV